MQKSIYSREAEVLRRMLKALRESRGMTQEQLAAILGRPRYFISRYETGQTQLDVPEVRHILRALAMPFVEFMRLYDEELTTEGFSTI